MSRNRTLGAPYEQAVVTTDFTTEPHIDRYLVATPHAGPGVIVLLDPSAYNGDQVTIIDVTNNAATHPITILGTLVGGDNTIDTDGGSLQCTFSDALGAWTVEVGSNSDAEFNDLVDILQNQIAETNAAPIAAATPVVWDSSPFTFTTVGSGNVRIRASMQVASVGGGAAPGDAVTFNLRRDGAIIAPPIINAELSPIHGIANATFCWNQVATPGTTHTFGIQCVDVTTPTGTLSVPAGGAIIQVEETP